jgi:hypothetical protein
MLCMVHWMFCVVQKWHKIKPEDSLDWTYPFGCQYDSWIMLKARKSTCKVVWDFEILVSVILFVVHKYLLSGYRCSIIEKEWQ